jgi:hypothetical protein
VRDLLNHFKRDAPGVWICLTSARITAQVTIPAGARVFAGVLYDGVDVGRLLEADLARQDAASRRNSRYIEI